MHIIMVFYHISTFLLSNRSVSSILFYDPCDNALVVNNVSSHDYAVDPVNGDRPAPG